ncbi:unnamed protein product [Mytilus edulis]|uniref:RNase H type-1 domain-containing protein n=1 Tax=Mytilus edulis TaxID=6550 RepID=A0A8S3SGM5_MYTED|nr:unnamed protein product [Mytilus edulis]
MQIFKGNDEADLLAKQAAEEATQLLPKNNIITLQDVKQGAHKSVMLKWQRRWELSNTGRDLFEITPNVKNIPIFDYQPKNSSASLYNLELATQPLTIINNAQGKTPPTYAAVELRKHNSTTSQSAPTTRVIEKKCTTKLQKKLEYAKSTHAHC